MQTIVASAFLHICAIARSDSLWCCQQKRELLIYKLNGCSVYNYFCGTLHNRRRCIADVNDCVCA